MRKDHKDFQIDERHGERIRVIRKAEIGRSERLKRGGVPLLTDWLPVAEVLVADRVSLEASIAFKKLGMDMPETEDSERA